jgi:uncharacterized protein
MGSFSEHVVDFAVLFAIILVQGQIARHFLRFADRRFPPRWKKPARIVPFAALAWFLTGFALSFPGVATPWMPQWLSGLLRGGTYAWVLASTAAYLIWLVTRLFSEKVDAETHPGRRRALVLAGKMAAGAPFAMLGFGALVGRTDFGVREVDVPISGLPEELEGIRLAVLSDIHLSPFLSEQELARVVGMTNEMRPHAAFVTGDLISTAADPLDACLRQLARLRADAGVLGCLGNHEIYADAEDFAEMEGRRLGIDFLRMQSRPLRFGKAILNVAGVDYQSIRHPPSYLRGAENLVIADAVNVLLSHNPDVFPVAARKGYDLTVGGHTHGGQVNVEILRQNWNIARFLTPYVYGSYRLPGLRRPAEAYVTRGVGTIGLPARIGASPEIALLRLRKA